MKPMLNALLSTTFAVLTEPDIQANNIVDQIISVLVAAALPEMI